MKKIKDLIKENEEPKFNLSVKKSDKVQDWIDKNVKERGGPTLEYLDDWVEFYGCTKEQVIELVSL